MSAIAEPDSEDSNSSSTKETRRSGRVNNNSNTTIGLFNVTGEEGEWRRERDDEAAELRKLPHHQYYQSEIQTASGEWMNEFSKSRRESEAEGMKKSIRRSWTISSPQNDRIPQPRNGAEYRNYSSLPPGPEATDYPSLARHHPSNNHYNSYESNPEEYIEPVVNPQQQRRVLRQSTMPNPEVNQYNSNNNLMPPGSPKQQISPQYSPYNTDNEDNEMPNNPMPIRYGIRRQSTLPCPPNFQSSTSPNRMYSRSPERNEGDAPRMPPFLRQSTFPSNTSDPLFQQPHHQRPKLLPTSPNRHPFNKSPEMAEADSNNPMKRYQMMRQNTLPNPDQHVKLLPTSPPKKLSPQQYLKRSPEFIRQNTLPNPEGMNTLSIPQHKFLPISPRQKQSFLFPQPHQQQQNPRPFLSQQNFPTMNDEAAVTQSSSPVESTGHREHSKMIKVRSHSNEEYGMNRALEGRRLLPEIPTNRSPRYNFLIVTPESGSSTHLSIIDEP